MKTLGKSFINAKSARTFLCFSFIACFHTADGFVQISVFTLREIRFHSSLPHQTKRLKIEDRNRTLNI